MKNPELLTALFELTKDGIVVVDCDGIIRMVNPAVCGLFGYSANELSGQNISVLLDPVPSLRNNVLVSHHVPAFLPAFIGAPQELTGRKKDGTLFPFHFVVSEFSDSGQKGYVGIFHDLSMLKQAESSLDREKKLGQVKTRLVSMASHEFRSPLSRIQLSASLVERYYERLDRDRIMDHLKKIRAAVDDMTGTLNDFLSVERIDAGNIKPDRKPFDVSLLAAELTDQMQQQAGNGTQIVRRHRGENSTVYLDRALLRHCLVNLLSNAVKYSKDAGTVELITAVSGGKCTITVKDHGIGIPVQDQPQLFGAFFRASNASDIPGTGLGLNIVKNYVQLMHGRVFFRSRERQGTTFTLTFTQ